MKITDKSSISIILIVIISGLASAYYSFITIESQQYENFKSSDEYSVIQKKRSLENNVDTTINLIDETFDEYVENNSKIYGLYKKQLNDTVNVVFNIIDYIHNPKNGSSTAEKKQVSLSVIKTIRNSKSEYFWIHDKDSKMIRHSFYDEYTGKNLDEFKDISGNSYYTKMTEVCLKDGEGYVEYILPGVAGEKPVRKLAYVRLFRPWGWIIGTEVNHDVSNDGINDKIIRKIKSFHIKSENSFLSIINFETNEKLIDISIDPFNNFVTKLKLTVNSQKNFTTLKREDNISISVNNEDKLFSGLVYSKLYKKTNWLITAGSYIENIENSSDSKNWMNEELNSKFKTTMAVIIGATSALVFLVIIISSVYSKKEEEIEERQTLERETVQKDNRTDALDRTKDFKPESEYLEKVEVEKKALVTKTREADKIIKEAKNSRLVLDETSKELIKIVKELAPEFSGNSATAVNSSTMNSGLEKKTGPSNLSTAKAAGNKAVKSVNSLSETTIEISNINKRIYSNSENALTITSEMVNQVSEASTKVNNLDDAATNIENVAESITEISKQTNLLALNATIEAARAGDAGRGFSVVANEIKVLSKQTDEATKKIKSIISVIRESSNVTVTEIESIASVITDIDDLIKNIVEDANVQSAAFQDMENVISTTSDDLKKAENIIDKHAKGNRLNPGMSSKLKESAEKLEKLSKSMKGISQK